MNKNNTRLFLDSGDPFVTKDALNYVGKLDGQTTNPSLIARNLEARDRLKNGNKFSRKELDDFYRGVIEDVAELIPGGAISIEVYADAKTSAQDMIRQAREMHCWCENSYIKLPITNSGLEAAGILVKEGVQLNMTLCFLQIQAAAVYCATVGAKKGQVLVSPFIGRLDDVGQNGIDLIKNILKMYRFGDGHVEVLAASLRNVDHVLACLQAGVDIITAPVEVYRDWAIDTGREIPCGDFVYNKGEKSFIGYHDIDLDQECSAFNSESYLTKNGLEKFASDWNGMIGDF